MSSYEVTAHAVDGGLDLVVSCKAGLSLPDGTTSTTLHLRKDHGPRVGERIMMGKVGVKVLEKRYDCNGHLWVLDEDTRAWFKW